MALSSAPPVLHTHCDSRQTYRGDLLHLQSHPRTTTRKSTPRKKKHYITQHSSSPIPHAEYSRIHITPSNYPQSDMFPSDVGSEIAHIQVESRGVDSAPLNYVVSKKYLGGDGGMCWFFGCGFEYCGTCVLICQEYVSWVRSWRL